MRSERKWDASVYRRDASIYHSTVARTKRHFFFSFRAGDELKCYHRFSCDFLFERYKRDRSIEFSPLSNNTYLRKNPLTDVNRGPLLSSKAIKSGARDGKKDVCLVRDVCSGAVGSTRWILIWGTSAGERGVEPPLARSTARDLRITGSLRSKTVPTNGTPPSFPRKGTRGKEKFAGKTSKIPRKRNE